MQMRPPQMVTILQPSLSHIEVVSGPRKNMIPVASDPTQAGKNVIKITSLTKLHFYTKTETYHD